MIKDIFEVDVYETYFSKLKNPLFSQNLGQAASAIFLDNSLVELGGTNDDINFFGNIASNGNTIYSTFSQINSNNMNFHKNVGI